MKALLGLMVAALLALSVMNWLQIRQLQEDIGRLNREVKQQQDAQGVMAEAVRAVEAARLALARTDLSSAHAAFDTARQRVQDAARTAGTKAGPALDWLQKQTADLERQVHERMRTSH